MNGNIPSQFFVTQLVDNGKWASKPLFAAAGTRRGWSAL